MRRPVLSPFLKSVTEPGAGVISPKRFGEALHLPLSELARLANVHRNTMAQSPASPIVQQRLGVVARIVTAAADMLGDDTPRAVVWFLHQPLAGFDGRTAAELTADGHAAAVIEHLEMLRDGVYA